MIYLRIDNYAEPLAVNLVNSAVLGRSDKDTVEIDLIPFSAEDKGVSRRHAILERERDTITLMDLNSVSGTFLNGRWLQPLERHVLRDGDEIRLGIMSLRISF